MALSGRKVQHIQARVCQQERTPGESMSSSARPADCLINCMNTCKCNVYHVHARVLDT